MQEFLQNNDTEILFSAMIGALALAVVLEAVFPRRTESVHVDYRWTNNIALSLVNQLNVNWFTAFVTLTVAVWGKEEQFGLFHWSGVGFWPSVLVTILTFDLIAYWFHRALHAFPWMWRIHAVHHSDTDLDVTTTYRSHPVELIVIAPFTVPVVLLLGFPPAAIVIYQLLRTLLLIFSHSNIRIPESVDRWLRYFIVTPDYHRVHHSSDRPFTNSNYGAALPLYDYVFGTARRKPYSEHSTMELGLEYFRAREDSRLDRLLLMPFVWRPRREDSVALSAVSAASANPENTWQAVEGKVTEPTR